MTAGPSTEQGLVNKPTFAEYGQHGVDCLKVTQGETKDRQTVLHIEVDDKLLEQHMGRAHQRLASRVNVPGFRKGKAPRSVVERFVGREYLLEEAMESLIPAAVNVAVEQEGIEASATPRVSVVEREPVIKIDATVPLSPEATLGDYSTISVDEEAEPVKEEEIEESVQRLVDANANWNDVERPVEAGDLITFTVLGTVGDETLIEQTDSEYLAVSDNPNPIPGFTDQLVGIEAGGTKEFSIEIPEDYSREELAGKTANFTVSVASMREKSLPELSDELVKGLGEGINTVADLRSRIRENLEARAQQTLRESLEEKIVDELVERSTFELSPLMIEHEAEHVLQDQQNALARYNIPFEQFMAQTGKSSEEVFEGAKETAENRVKRTLVMDRLAEAEAIEPTDEEIEQEIEAWKTRQDDGHGHDQNEDPAATRNAVIAVLKRRKAVDKAIELATSKTNGSGSTARKTAKKTTKASSKTAGKQSKTKETVAETDTDIATPEDSETTEPAADVETAST